MKIKGCFSLLCSSLFVLLQRYEYNNIYFAYLRAGAQPPFRHIFGNKLTAWRRQGVQF